MKIGRKDNSMGVIEFTVSSIGDGRLEKQNRVI